MIADMNSLWFRKRGIKMKKISKLLLVLLLLLPAIVFADVAGPDSKPFEIEVVKTAGVKYYKSFRDREPAGTLPKGTTMKIYFQSTYNGEIYLNGDYENKNIYIKAEDVVAKGELNVKDSTVSSTEKPIKIKITDEVILRKGPSPAFEETGRLENVETTYEYYIINPYYVYVNYKGTKGWLFFDDSVYYGGHNYVTRHKISNSCGSIPSDTILEDVWQTNSNNASKKINIEYDGCNYNVSEYYIIKLNEKAQIYEIKEKIRFFTDLEKNDSIDIKAGERISILSEDSYNSSYYNYYYVEYEGERGWIYVNLSNVAEFVKEGKEVVKSKDKEEDEDEDDEDEIDSSTIVLICVITGVAIALTAIVTIVLVNKKNKKANEKTENKE